MNNELLSKIKLEVLSDFSGYEQKVNMAFIEIESFFELAFDYYNCKRLIRHFLNIGKLELARDYEILRLELQEEIKEYVIKKYKK